MIKIGDKVKISNDYRFENIKIGVVKHFRTDDDTICVVEIETVLWEVWVKNCIVVKSENF